ncbi:MAG: hypothetical protein HY324_02740 [Chlamydiia bacterium]|nr:hypothetical protein [Chlamydiia bacterium]
MSGTVDRIAAPLYTACMRFLFGLFLMFLFTSTINGNSEEDSPQHLINDSIVTEHTYHASNGKKLHYSAVAGWTPVSNNKAEELARLFYIAYFVDEDEDRPITFFFPGGPGGAGGWTAICSIGPRRMELSQEGKKRVPPYRMIDNPESLLPWTDLVFVDPVGTGYSPMPDEETCPNFPFFNTDGDIAILAKFVDTFISCYERWNSPKYMGGFSYGAARCCGLAEALSWHDISLHGILLLSPAIDYATLLSQHNLFLSDALLIPTFAATAWYYGKLWPHLELEEVLHYARRFCYDDYLPALLQPSRLSPIEQQCFYKNLAELIGLSEETVCRYSGRFDEELYTKEFFASEKKVLGGLDTRYSSDWSLSGKIEADPSYSDMQGTFSAFKAYLQKELKLCTPFIPYQFSSCEGWCFATYDSLGWPELLQRVRRTLVANPEMQIFIGSGYYDCRTPFAATEYCFDHLNLPQSYRNNLLFSYYPAGHGFIFDLPSLQKFKNDLTQFYTNH